MLSKIGVICLSLLRSYESMIMNNILRKVSKPYLQEHFIINFHNIDCDCSKNVKDKEI